MKTVYSWVKLRTDLDYVALFEAQLIICYCIKVKLSFGFHWEGLKRLKGLEDCEQNKRLNQRKVSSKQSSIKVATQLHFFILSSKHSDFLITFKVVLSNRFFRLSEGFSKFVFWHWLLLHSLPVFSFTSFKGKFCLLSHLMLTMNHSSIKSLLTQEVSQCCVYN